MADAEDNFRHLYKLLSQKKKFAIAVSGGVDSTALMVLVAQWAKTNKTGDKFHVLSVDHGLRKTSASEAEMVREKACELGFKAAVLTWLHDGHDTGIQKKARQARYDLIGNWCAENAYDGVVTAHTRDDQAETLLMRLARGSGVDGLAAMASKTCVEGVMVYRPLLGVSRNKLRDVLNQSGVSWIEDPGNFDDQFERVRMRALLAKMNTAGIEQKSLALSAARAGRASQALETITDDFMRRSVEVFDTAHCAIDFQALQSQPDEIAIRVLGRATDWASGGGEYLKLAKLERLYQTIFDLENKHGEQQTLAGARIVRRKREIVIGREFGRMNHDVQHGETVWDNRFKFDGRLSVFPYGVIIDSDQRQRPQDLPYFVACALPVIVTPDGKQVVPHLDSAKSGVVKLVKLLDGVGKVVINTNAL